MTTEVPTKLRLVRCPKCRTVLPESPNIPVYQCGGCGAILQAKRHKNNIKDTELQNHETGRSQKIDLERTSEDKEARRLSQEELSSTGALLSNENNGSDHGEIQEKHRKQPAEMKSSSALSEALSCDANDEGVQYGGVQVSDEAASSIELDHQHESEESSPVAEAHSAMNSSPRDDQPNPNGKQPGGLNISNEVVSSSEVDHQESEGGHRQMGETVNYQEQYERRDEDVAEYRKREQSEDDQVASPTEFNHQRSSVDTKSLDEEDANQGYLEESKGGNGSDSDGRGRKHHGTVKFSGELSSLADKVDGITATRSSSRDEDSNEYCNQKQPEDVNFPDEVATSAELNPCQSDRSSVDSKSPSEKDENKDRLAINSGRNGTDISGWKREHHETMRSSDELSSSPEHINHEVEELSPVSGANTEMHLELKRPVSSESWIDENLLSGSPRNSVANRFSSESFLTDGLMSPPNEHTAEDQNRHRESWSDENLLSGSSRSSIPHRFSVESFLSDGIMSPHNRARESPLVSPSNSMAHRFSGESFLRDGLISPRNEHSRDRDGNEGVSSIYMSENLALLNSSSEFTDAQRDMLKARTTSINYADEGSVSSSDESDGLVSLRCDHLSRKKLKEAEAGSTKTVVKRDEGVNKIRSGFPAMQPHGRNSSSVSPENNCYAVKNSQWRQDELGELARNVLPPRTRTRFKTDEGTSKVPSYSKNHQGGYHNGNHLKHVRNDLNHRMISTSPKRPEDLEKEKIELLKMVYELQTELKRTHLSQPPEAGMYRDLIHTRTARSCNLGRRPYQNRDPRIPFSAEIRSHHQDDTYCVHCCPQDWQFQALLPPHTCCNKTQSVFHSGRQSYNLHHHSGTSSPRHCASSEVSDDHWRIDHEAKRIHREKTHSAKSHVRPILGGAPLVACYKCFEVLRLPADFLLFKRKVHQLQCSGCSAILKFTLHKGMHIVPYEVYTADADVDFVAPPPSEVDAFSDRMKFASPSRATDHVLSSDDYGPPKSYSTESDPFSGGRLFRARSNGRTVSSGSSYEPTGERKEESLLKGLGKKIYSHAGTFSSVGSSSKTSKPKSEIQKASVSPLHKLMGYASPSKVMER